MQQAKDTIAKKYGYENFEAIPYNHISSVNVRYENYQDIVNEVAIEYHRLMSEWVSVDAELPNIETRVLINSKNYIGIAELYYEDKDTEDEVIFWKNDNGIFADFETVKSWKPLPQPPK